MAQKKKKLKRDKGLPAWTPFERAQFPNTRNVMGHLVTRDKEVVFVNSRFQVCVVENVPNGLGIEGMTWLSIKNNTKNHRHDWRELQRIKNELCGRERDAIEIYPAESRLHDTADQFHLWVFPENAMLPIGFKGRYVSDADRPGVGSQRKFTEGFGHDDGMDEATLASTSALQPGAVFFSHPVFLEHSEGDDEFHCSCRAVLCEQHKVCVDVCDEDHEGDPS